MNSNETWLPVVGYENLYEVSDLGRVRSLVSGRMLRPSKSRWGYLRVNLSNNGERKTCSVHRLVCTAFHENPLNLPQVNHKNEVKTDNRAENLEWCDAMYNNHYGTRAQMIREIYQYTLSGEFVAWYPSILEAAQGINGNAGNIANCAYGERNTAEGFQWSFTPMLFLNATEGRFNNTRCKHVFQYTLDGHFIREWISAAEVRRQLGYSFQHISLCCLGKRNSANGYRWFYSFQGYSLK